VVQACRAGDQVSPRGTSVSNTLAPCMLDERRRSSDDESSCTLCARECLCAAAMAAALAPITPALVRTSFALLPAHAHDGMCYAALTAHTPPRHHCSWHTSCRYGLTGHIREPVGTHGLMKVIFNKHVKQNDTVCLQLYKRVFPKFAGERVEVV
jgi:40S ribosome biogenesis protein Tsr1 and BMS1 C-terminal